ncbi:putative carboxylesterase 2 [Iris pallida]|uniref:Carboxylesterase 2 n=1 Tax=Iris pallida TaxID=29817 RepID=A0AAX6HG41_IRIPA|nr:putative carboxylesterase 2 [Iris pallida]
MDTDTAAAKEAVQYELFPFVRVYTTGRIERILETDVLPPGLDPDTGVVSKDVTLRPDTGLSVRLYLPPATAAAAADKKIPVLVYYHGGGFVIETAASPTYHNYLNSLVAKAGVLAVSVDYRRAPEHPLPAAYEDSWAALEWATSEPPADPWLADRGDLRRVFLAGDSAGANIAHHMAMRAGAAGGSVRLEGIALVHPYFWGKEPVGSETRDAPARAFAGALWRLVCPSSNDDDGEDDPRINPVGLEGLGCGRVLVSVAAEDTLRERGVDYYERLRGSGWGGTAELAEADGVGHVFHLQDAKSDKAAAEMDRMVAFLNGKD